MVRQQLDVNCISSDKKVVTRKQIKPTLMPPPPALPPTRPPIKSIAPYLAYELDALRRQQKCMPHTRNLNHFKNAIAGSKSSKGDNYICNRYCGGSHTVTTPRQRVARVGNFLEQWRPESAQVNEGLIKGTDGQMYKSGGKSEVKTAKFESQDMDDDDDGYMPRMSMKSRQSIMVQGGILSQRTKFKGESKLPEAGGPPLAEPPNQEKKASVQRDSVTHRVSADLSGKRTSRASSASIKKTPSAGKTLPLDEEAPPAEAAPPAEGNSQAEAAFAEESLPRETPADEVAPAESPEAEAPVEDAPPAEEPPSE